MNSNSSNNKFIVVPCEIQFPEDNSWEDEDVEKYLAYDGIIKENIIYYLGPAVWDAIVDLAKSMWEESWKELQEKISYLHETFEPFLSEIEEAQIIIEKRAAERKRWGHPPKVLYANYSQPMRKIRPSARSCIRQRSNRRRE